MENKIFIGTIKRNFSNGDFAGERLYLSKHSWDCGWYWGFGYIGNKSMHTHFDSQFLNAMTDVKDIFVKPVFTQDEWWILRDLFIQAYALSKASAVYRYGGHQTSQAFRFSELNEEQAKRIENSLNRDTEILLNKIWEIVVEADNRRTKKGK